MTRPTNSQAHHRPSMSLERFTIPLLLALTLSAGCRWPGRHTSTRPHLGERRKEAARLTYQAGKHRGNAKQAEGLLRKAIAQDSYYGPARNNLGTILLAGGKMYEAAWEFQYAAKLMPNDPDPPFNLAALYERAGKPALAAEYYEKVLSINPDDVAAAASLARIYVSVGHHRSRAIELLDVVQLRHPDRAWRQWAHLAQLRLRRPKAATATFPALETPTTRPNPRS